MKEHVQTQNIEDEGTWSFSPVLHFSSLLERPRVHDPLSSSGRRMIYLSHHRLLRATRQLLQTNLISGRLSFHPCSCPCPFILLVSSFSLSLTYPSQSALLSLLLVRILRLSCSSPCDYRPTVISSIQPSSHRRSVDDALKA